MSYRVKANGYTMEADSLEEYRSILALLGIISESHGQSKVAASVKFADLSVKGKLEKFYDSVLSNPGQMLKVLRAIRLKPDGLTDLELKEILKLQKNAALPGIMAGISKRAEKVGLTHQDILIKEVPGGEGGALYRYKLTEAMKELMEIKEPIRRAYPTTPQPLKTDAEG